MMIAHHTSIPRLLFFVAALVASTKAQDPGAIDFSPASIACNAAYSEPCARTNSEYLARTVAHKLAQATNVVEFLEAINKGDQNLNEGFYPFVVERSTGTCVAHGASRRLAGKTIKEIFAQTNISFAASADDLHGRFLAANYSGVQYLWSDGVKADPSTTREEFTVHSKLAFVININDVYYLGVGYENQPLPVDLPCDARYDSWCSLTNVRSLVGKAQFRLNQAKSIEAFEEAVYDISYSPEYKLQGDSDQRDSDQGDFYLFLYNKTGHLKAHGKHYFALTLADVYVANEIGNRAEGEALHTKFLEAVSTDESAFVQYKWKGRSEDKIYLKIAYLARVGFESDHDYYIGAGFKFERDENPSGPVPGKPCSDEYNLPCSFATTIGLASHALSHAISSPLSINEMFADITNDPQFKFGEGKHKFYIFAYDFENAMCYAHGANESFVGKNLTQVFKKLNVTADADELHKRFMDKASQGGGWVEYGWRDERSDFFKKISYVFQINLGGKRYYGGIGFYNVRYRTREYAEKGKRKNKKAVLCTKKYNLPCSEVNTQSIVGQASARLLLALDEDSSTRMDVSGQMVLNNILTDITYSSDASFQVGDFRVSVFSVEANDVCDDNDGSGCCLASGGNSEDVGKTWQEILLAQNDTSVTGAILHKELFEASREGGGSVTKYGKKFWSARFRNNKTDYYVVSDYFMTEQPRTCDACNSNEYCADSDQEYCEERPITRHPAFIAVLVLFLVGAPLAACFVWYLKKKHKRIVDDMALRMEHQMQGMYEVIHDFPIRSADEYRRRIGLDTADGSTRNTVAVWYWEEDEAHITKHRDEMVLEGTRFVSYSTEITGQIEHAYKLFVEGRGFQKFRVDLTDKITSTVSGEKVNNSSTGLFYEINFETKQQKNASSNHVRAVRREEFQLQIPLEIMDSLPPLPSDLNIGSGEEQEDFLPTLRGQVIQVSKVHPGNQWLYGNVLYDPLLDEAMKNQSSDSQTDPLNTMLAHALHDRPSSGWFPRSLTQLADKEVMRKLLQKLGGAGMDNLAPPKCWNESGTEQVPLDKASSEYSEVAAFFSQALYAQRDLVQIVNITRLQNLPLWQSYAVKKETMKSRDAAHLAAYRVNNRDTSIEALERRWLFHGTHPDVIPKIIKQGFNRAFSGRNAVAYGRGVYFARDASYSAHPGYSTPDARGIQHMFLCRVAVGDWSAGRHGILTPDPKPHNPLELFDSTVDNVDNPSIFVIYHDAQAYPEYLVAFKFPDTMVVL
jgi:hypothetical protein